MPNPPVAPNFPVANQTNRLPIFLTNAGTAIARTASLGWRRSVQVIKKPLSFVQRVLVAPIQRRLTAVVKWIKGSRLRIAAKVSKATVRLRALVRRKPSAQALKIARLENHVASITKTLRTKEVELEQNEQELHQLQRQLLQQEALQSEQKKATHQQLTDRIQNLAEEVRGLQKALEKSKTEKKDLEKSIRDIKERASSLETSAATAEEEKRRTQTELRDLQANLATMVRKKKELEDTIAARAQEQTETEETLRVLMATKEKLETDLAAAQQEKKNLSSRVTEQQTQLQELNTTKQQLQHVTEALKELQASKEAVEVEAARTTATVARLTEEKRALEEKHNSLEKELEGRAQRTQTLEDLVGEKTNELEATHLQVEQLQHVTEALKQLQASKEAVEVEAARTTATVERLTEEKRALEEKHNSLEKELEGRAQRTQTLEDLVGEKTNELEATYLQVEQLRAKQQELEASQSQLVAAYALTSSENSEFKKQLEEEKTAQAELKSALEKQRELYASRTIEVEILNEEIERLNKIAQEQHSTIGSNVEKCETYETEIEALKKKQQALDAQRTKDAEAIERLQQRLVTKDTKIEELSKQVRLAEVQFQENQCQLEALNAKEHTFLESIQQKEAQIDALHGALEELQREKTDVDATLAALRDSEEDQRSQLMSLVQNNNATILALKDEIERQKTTLKILETQKKQLEDEKKLSEEHLKRQLREEQSVSTLIATQMVQVTEELAQAQAAQVRTQEDATKRIDVLTQQNDGLNAHCEELSTANMSYTQTLQANEERIEDLCRTIALHTSRIEELDASEKRLSARNENLQVLLGEEKAANKGFSDKLAQVGTAKQEIEEDYAKLSTMLEGLSAQKNAEHAALCELKTAYETLTQEKSILHDHNARLEEELAQEKKVAQERLNKIEVSLQTLTEEKESLEAQLVEYKKRYEELTEELNESTARVAALEKENVQYAQTLQQERAATDHALSELKAEVEEKGAALCKLREKQEAKEVEVASLKDAIARLESSYEEKNKALKAQIDALQVANGPAKVQGQKRVAEQTSELANLSSEMEELDSYLGNAMREINDFADSATDVQMLEKALEEKRAEIQRLEVQKREQEAAYKKTIDQLQQKLEENKNTHDTLTEELLLQKEKTVSIEVQLTEKMHAMDAVCKDLDATRLLLGIEHQENVQLQTTVATVEHALREVQDKCIAAEQQVQLLEKQIAALKNEHTHLQGSVEAYNALHQEKEKIEAQLQSITQELTEHKNSQGQQENAIEDQKQQIATLQEQEAKLSKEVVQLTEELDTKKNAYVKYQTAAQENISVLQKELATLQKQIECYEESERELNAKVEQLTKDLDSSNRTTEDLKNELERKIDHLKEDLSKCQMELKHSEDHLKKFQSANKILSGEPGKTENRCSRSGSSSSNEAGTPEAQNFVSTAASPEHSPGRPNVVLEREDDEESEDLTLSNPASPVESGRGAPTHKRTQSLPSISAHEASVLSHAMHRANSVLSRAESVLESQSSRSGSPASTVSEEKIAPTTAKKDLTLVVGEEEQITPEKPAVAALENNTPSPVSKVVIQESKEGLNGRSRVSSKEEQGAEMVDVPLKASLPPITVSPQFNSLSLKFSQELCSMEFSLRTDHTRTDILQDPQTAPLLLKGEKMVYDPGLKMKVPAVDFYRWTAFFPTYPAIFQADDGKFSVENSFKKLMDTNAEHWKKVVCNLLAHAEEGSAVHVVNVVELAIANLELLTDLQGALVALPYLQHHIKPGLFTWSSSILKTKEYRQLHEKLVQIPDFSQKINELDAATIKTFISGIVQQCAAKLEELNTCNNKQLRLVSMTDEQRECLTSKCSAISCGQWYGLSVAESMEKVSDKIKCKLDKIAL